MKNPMTPEQQHQAIDDNAAGYDMQYRPFRDNGSKWVDRVISAGTGLNFHDNEYRRKPELIERYVNVYKDGKHSVWRQYRYAKEQANCNESVVRTVRLVEDPTWTEPEPEETNAWRYIVPGEWPECKPGDAVILGWANGDTTTTTAYCINWKNPDAVKWKYAED